MRYGHFFLVSLGRSTKPDTAAAIASTGLHTALVTEPVAHIVDSLPMPASLARVLGQQETVVRSFTWESTPAQAPTESRILRRIRTEAENLSTPKASTRCRLRETHESLFRVVPF